MWRVRDGSRVGAARVWAISALVSAGALGCARTAENRAESARAVDSRVTDTERVSLAWHEIPLDPTDGEPRPAAPLLLTASDGTVFEPMVVRAHGVVVGPLAFTELHLTFKNPAARELDATLALTLPTSAAIARLALGDGNRLIEGEIMERRVARTVYERSLQLTPDPALPQAGNAFRARVFRIGAHEEKRIVVSYSEAIGAENPSYRIPLRGLPELRELTATVHHFEPGSGTAGIDRHRIYRVEKTRVVPDRDFRLPLARSPIAPAQPAPSSVAVKAGHFAVARVTPRIEATPDPPKALAILIDTSASRALSLSRDVEAVQKVLGALRAAGAGDLPIQVYAFDQGIEAIYRGPASGFESDSVKQVLARGAFGTTDLGEALSAVARGEVKDRILLVTDGVFTTARHSSVRIDRLLGVERVDVLLTGPLENSDSLARLTKSGRRQGVAVDAGLPPSRVAAMLSLAVAKPLAIEVPGARFSYPRFLTGLVPGDSALIYVELRRGHALNAIGIDGQKVAVSPTRAPEALVERAVVRAQIDDIWQRIEAGGYQRDEIALVHTAILQLSTKHRVPSPLTSFVVLEDEGDYIKFDIKRTALQDLLAVGPDGLAVVQRGKAWWRKFVRELPLSFGSVRRDPFPHRSGSLPAAAREADRDHDGIPDAIDRCPDVGPGGLFGSVDRDGCIGFYASMPIGESETPLRFPLGFAHGSSRPFAGSTYFIGSIATQLRLDPKLRVVVRGHADEGGDAAKILRLSEERARAVRDYLISYGVPSRRLAATGCGSSKPVAYDAPAGVRHQRLVDFVVVSKSFDEGLCAAPLPPTPPGQSLPAPLPDPDKRSAAPPPSAPSVYSLPAQRAAPHEGPFAEVMADLVAGRAGDALEKARAMLQKEPGSVLALFALGSSYEALRRPHDAARTYASIIDLYPSFVPYWRFAGSLFDRLAIAGVDPVLASRARELAVDIYRHALDDRPEDASSHQLYAFALVRAGRYREAFDILDKASQSRLTMLVADTFESDLALVARAWSAAEPAQAKAIADMLAERHIAIDNRPSLRIAATWEASVSDVDFYLDTGQAPKAGDDFARLFPGRFVADVWHGFGPDVFRNYGEASKRGVRLGVHHGRAEGLRVAFGKVELIRHDGAGRLSFDERPFVLMTENGYADLGSVEL